MTRELIKEYVDELLEYEDKHNVLHLTTRETIEFQLGVQALFDEGPELIDKVLKVIDATASELEMWDSDVRVLKERIQALSEGQDNGKTDQD